MTSEIWNLLYSHQKKKLIDCTKLFKFQIVPFKNYFNFQILQDPKFIFDFQIIHFKKYKIEILSYKNVERNIWSCKKRNCLEFVYVQEEKTFMELF